MAYAINYNIFILPVVSTIRILLQKLINVRNILNIFFSQHTFKRIYMHLVIRIVIQLNFLLGNNFILGEMQFYKFLI